MGIANQKKPWSLDTVAEIIGDLFCFDWILEIKRRMKNDEAKAYVSNFLRILAPIYVHEIAKALDRLDRYYYFYYIKYRFTGKL